MLERITNLKMQPVYDPGKELPTEPNPNVPEIDPEEWEEKPTKLDPKRPEIEPDKTKEEPIEPNRKLPERPPLKTNRGDRIRKKN